MVVAITIEIGIANIFCRRIYWILVITKQNNFYVTQTHCWLILSCYQFTVIYHVKSYYVMILCSLLWCNVSIIHHLHKKNYFIYFICSVYCFCTTNSIIREKLGVVHNHWLNKISMYSCLKLMVKVLHFL